MRQRKPPAAASDVAEVQLRGVLHGPRWLLAVAGAVAALLGLAYWAATAAAPAAAPASTFIVTAYVPEYRLEHVVANMAAIAPRVTELILFSVQPTSTGDVAFGAGGLTEAQLHAAAAAARTHGVPRVLVCLGGGGRSSGFPALVASPAARARLARRLVTLCAEHALAGVDLDWEAPTTPEHIRGYSQLLVELRAAFAPHALTLTVAIHHWTRLGPAALRAVDRVHLMAYDLPRQHSTFADARHLVRELTAAAAAQGGVSPAKLALGIPLYGRGVADPARVRTYAEIAADAAADTPTVDTTADGLYYNGPATVAAKTAWARQHGLAGVMFWEAGQDALSADRSLLAVAARAAGLGADAA